MLSLRVARAAEQFWLDNPAAGEFPREMVGAVTWALPVTVVRLPRLRPAVVRRWLQKERGVATIAESVPADARALCGCLSPFTGSGYIFVDSTDSPDEIRFTIAHEAAHFMLDYLEPRERLAAAISAQSIEVFDGVRRADAGERLASAISGVDVEMQARLFARDGAGNSLCAATGPAEQAADTLALELLAPEAHVLAGWREAQERALWDRPSAGLAERLERFYGLPASVAGTYARRLLVSEPAGSFDLWLGRLAHE